MTKPLPWRGWTLVERDGSIVTSGFRDPEPFTFKRKWDAKAAIQGGQRVVRCELRVVK